MHAPPHALFVAGVLLLSAEFQSEFASLAANRTAAARAHVSGARGRRCATIRALLRVAFDLSLYSPTTHQVSLPQHVDANGYKVREVAHSADVLRLRLMRDVGGVYMDADVITVKSFDPLLKACCLQHHVFGCFKAHIHPGKLRHGPRG